MTYAEKLLDPRWQKKRAEILLRDGFACRNCGDKTRTLHVHHCVYIKGLEPWEYTGSLLTLCSDCHIERHNAQYCLLMATVHMTCEEIQSLASSIAVNHAIKLPQEYQ